MGDVNGGVSAKTIVIASVLGAGVLGLFLTVAVIGGVWVYRAGGGTVPQPTPPPNVTLSAVVGEDAAKVEAFFSALATVTEYTGGIKTTGQFRDTYRLAVATFKASDKLPDLAAADPIISSRIEAAIGLDDTALTTDSRRALVGVLRTIALEVK